MRKNCLLTLCALATVSAAGCGGTTKGIIQTERPAMIVRGGSVEIEIEEHADNVVWTGLDREWTPSHPTGPSVADYRVTVEPLGATKPPAEPECQAVGGKVTLRFKSPTQGRKKFTFKRPKVNNAAVPKLDAEVGLVSTVGHGRLINNPDFAIQESEVEVGSRTCRFDPRTQQVRIQPRNE